MVCDKLKYEYGNAWILYVDNNSTSYVCMYFYMSGVIFFADEKNLMIKKYSNRRTINIPEFKDEISDATKHPS